LRSEVNLSANHLLYRPLREYRSNGISIQKNTNGEDILLGPYGNFERDSDGDGLADGWSKWYGPNSSYSLSSSAILENYSQQVTRIADASGPKGGFGRSFQVTQGETYFVSVYARLTTSVGGKVKLIVAEKDANNIWQGSKEVINDSTQWKRLYAKYTISDANSVWFMIVGAVENSDLSVETTGIFDAFLAIRLDDMGTLPLPLQQLYSATYWHELSEEQLAALLPFCSGVCSLGFAWESDV